MALNEDKILSNKFVFVSYSHKDAEAVIEDVKSLLSKGVRIWFDENMRIGENWEEVAERILRHKNCVGVIFYNSANSFSSKAVQKEQSLTRELEHQYWSVHLDSKIAADMAMDAVQLLMSTYGPTSDRATEYLTKIASEQTKMFNDKILCIMRKESSKLVQEIYEKVAVPNRLVDNEDNFIEDLHKSALASKDTNEITLGKYVGGEYVGPEKPANAEDQRFGIANDLIQLNGRNYITKELRWRLMYVEDGKAVLICNKILRQDSFDEGKEFLENIFCKLAFSMEEKSKLGDIKARYMTEEDLGKCIDKSAIDLTIAGKLKHWWIDAEGLTENWKQTFSSSVSYKNGFSRLIKKGIRPVIETSSQILI